MALSVVTLGSVTVLALAVMTTAVGTLHNTGRTIGTLEVAVVVTRLSGGLVGLIKHNDHCNEDSSRGGEEEPGGRHVF